MYVLIEKVPNGSLAQWLSPMWQVAALLGPGKSYKFLLPVIDTSGCYASSLQCRLMFNSFIEDVVEIMTFRKADLYVCCVKFDQ